MAIPQALASLPGLSMGGMVATLVVVAAVVDLAGLADLEGTAVAAMAVGLVMLVAVEVAVGLEAGALVAAAAAAKVVAAAYLEKQVVAPQGTQDFPSSGVGRSDLARSRTGRQATSWPKSFPRCALALYLCCTTSPTSGHIPKASDHSRSIRHTPYRLRWMFGHFELPLLLHHHMARSLHTGP